jgi:phosphatidylglycerophosphate synthase
MTREAGGAGCSHPERGPAVPDGSASPRDAGGSRWSSLPNLLSAFRLAALLPLWILALLGEATWLAVGVAVAAFTDVLDGFVARRMGLTTSFGSRLDSVADHLLSSSVLLWLLWLRPEFFAREYVLLLAWAAFGAMTLLIGWLRFRRFGGLHLYSAKLAGTLGYLFAIWLLLTGDYRRTTFFVVLVTAFIAVLETLVMFLTARRVDEHAGSILGRAGSGSERGARSS